MANSYNKGRIVLDTATSQVVATNRRVKIAYILFVSNSANDQAIIRESSSGPIVFKLSDPTGKDQQLLDFSENPVVMDGVYIDSLSSNCVIILYTTSEGSK